MAIHGHWFLIKHLFIYLFPEYTLVGFFLGDLFLLGPSAVANAAQVLDRR